MYRGRIRFEVPMLWTMGFMVTFVIGGMTGVLLAVPPADFALHNSLFLIAHFHNVIIGGVLFGLMAGITYWFPKAFGYKLDQMCIRDSISSGTGRAVVPGRSSASRSIRPRAAYGRISSRPSVRQS